MKVCVILFLVGLPSYLSTQGPPGREILLSELLAIETKMEDTKYLLSRSAKMTMDVEDLTLTPTKDMSLKSRSVFTDSQEHVRIYFYSQSNPNNAAIFNLTQARYLEKLSNFSTTKKSLIIIHGWKNNNGSSVNTEIKAAVLKMHDVNIFVVDWSQVADQNYLTAKGDVPMIGRLVADFVKDLRKLYNYPLSYIQIAGHSLGAHVAGFAGKFLNGQVAYIVGLDPAGPLYSLSNSETRLAKTDAEFVEVIHTCGKLLGFFHPIGDVDYYPNGGLFQPGCGIFDDIDGTCSHARAYQYYAESIRNGGFLARKCPLYFNYLLGKCERNKKSEMGQYHIYKNASGKYYLETNPSAPFAKN